MKFPLFSARRPSAPAEAKYRSPIADGTPADLHRALASQSDIIRIDGYPKEQSIGALLNGRANGQTFVSNKVGAKRPSAVRDSAGEIHGFDKQFAADASSRLADSATRFKLSSRPGIAFDPGTKSCVLPQHAERNREMLTRGASPIADLSVEQIGDIERASLGTILLSGPQQNSVALIRGDRLLQLAPLPPNALDR